jgi:hypothetical protein
MSKCFPVGTVIAVEKQSSPNLIRNKVVARNEMLKDMCALSALCLTVLTILGGYSQVIAETAPETAKQSEMRVAIRSELARRSVSLPEALLGQWTTNNGNTRYYFTRDQVTVINLLGAEPFSQRHERVMSYEVVSVNEAQGIVFLELETPLGWAESRMIRFSGNRQSVVESMDVMGHNFNSEWNYVDASQQPLVAEQIQAEQS